MRLAAAPFTIKVREEKEKIAKAGFYYSLALRHTQS
jgi:hypothetical protein